MSRLRISGAFRLWIGVVAALVVIAIAVFRFSPGETEAKLNRALFDIERLDRAWKQWAIEQGRGPTRPPTVRELNMYLPTPGPSRWSRVEQFFAGTLSFEELSKALKKGPNPPFPELIDAFGNPYVIAGIWEPPRLHPDTYAVAMTSRDPGRFVKFAPGAKP